MSGVLTRVLVLGSALAAVALQAWLAAPGWQYLPQASALALAVGLLAGRFLPALLVPILLAGAYVLPALFTAALGRFHFTYLTVWLAGLLGPILAARGSWRWALPHPWKLPLAAWAAIVALAWPLVVLRETDFTLAFGAMTDVPTTAVGIAPPLAASWVLDVALIQLVGILWFDWLWRTFPARGASSFVHRVAGPLAAGAAAVSAVALYQSIVDIEWLSGGLWPTMHRAAGTMIDANATGMIAAMWSGPFVAFLFARRNAVGVAAGIGLVVLAWGGVWASGSRTGFIVAAAVLAVAAYQAWKHAAAGFGRRSIALALAGAVAVLTLLIVLAGFQTATPVGRLLASVEGQSAASVPAFAQTMWERDGYGTAATQMIADYPLFGVGIGTFHGLAMDYRSHLGLRISPDNAQNWYRHQLVELGLIGSLPWIVWVILFAGLLLRTRAQGDDEIPASLIGTALVALAVISLVAMPTQNAAVALTFWTFAFWYVRLVDPQDLRTAPSAPAGWRRWAPWAAVWILVAVHAAGTLHTARNDLRVPHRAMRGDWRYAYGIENPRELPGPAEFRWTGQKAVVNIPARGRWLKLTAWHRHPDAAERPVEAKIWTYGREVVLHAKRWDGTPVTRYVEAPEGFRRVLIETWVSRTWRPSDYGQEDTRDLGMALQWEFVQTPPAGPATRGRPAS